MIRHLLFWFRLMLLAGMLATQPALALEQSDLLPPEKAFAATVERTDRQLQLTLRVADGYYVYRDRIQLSTTPAGLLGPLQLPPGHIKQDPYFGRQAIYQHTTRITIALPNGAPARFTLHFRLQGCASAGVCYPPYTHQIRIGEPQQHSPGWTRTGATVDQPPADKELSLAAFFIAGIGLAFTACMYPLLPILSALIAGQSAQLSRRRALLLALAYVQGLALCYTLVGVIAGLTGSLLTVWLQQPAVVLGASLLLVLFALSMFDLFTIQLPASLQSRLADCSNRLPGGQLFTVFVMGILSALMIGPCIAPPLALALGYIGSTGDALFGGTALYIMALGLGVPLLVIAGLGGHYLPRAGRWMKGIKIFFGLVMLGLAVRMASPFLPDLPWARHDAAATAALVRFVPVSNDPLLSQRLSAAHGKVVIVDFYADWCVSCKEMDATTWRNPVVLHRLQSMQAMRIDVTQNSVQQQRMLQRFGLYGPPAVILIDGNGKVRDRIIGYIEAKALDQRLAAIEGSP